MQSTIYGTYLLNAVLTVPALAGLDLFGYISIRHWRGQVMPYLLRAVLEVLGGLLALVLLTVLADLRCLLRLVS